MILFPRNHSIIVLPVQAIVPIVTALLIVIVVIMDTMLIMEIIVATTALVDLAHNV
jgi:hypothetical protein